MLQARARMRVLEVVLFVDQALVMYYSILERDSACRIHDGAENRARMVLSFMPKQNIALKAKAEQKH